MDEKVKEKELAEQKLREEQEKSAMKAKKFNEEQAAKAQHALRDVGGVGEDPSPMHGPPQMDFFAND